jgi:hypothetical protein
MGKYLSHGTGDSQEIIVCEELGSLRLFDLLIELALLYLVNGLKNWLTHRVRLFPVNSFFETTFCRKKISPDWSHSVSYTQKRLGIDLFNGSHNHIPSWSHSVPLSTLTEMMPGVASPALISSLINTIIIVTKILSYTFTVLPYNTMDTSDYVVKKAIFRIEPWRFQYYHEWKHGNQNLFMKVFVSVASTNANSARDNRDE